MMTRTDSGVMRLSGIRMRLALALSDVHQIVLLQPLRAPENGTGDRCIIVPRQPADQFSRRFTQDSQPRREFRASIHVDLGSEAAEHIIEQLNVTLVQAGGAIGKKIRDSSECLGSTRARAALDHVLQFRNKWSTRHCKHHRAAHRMKTWLGPQSKKLSNESEGKVSYRIIGQRSSSRGRPSSIRACVTPRSGLSLGPLGPPRALRPWRKSLYFGHPVAGYLITIE